MLPLSKDMKLGVFTLWGVFHLFHAVITATEYKTFMLLRAQQRG